MKTDMFIDFLTFLPEIYAHIHLLLSCFSFPGYKCQALTKEIFSILIKLYQIFAPLLYRSLVHFFYFLTRVFDTCTII